MKSIILLITLAPFLLFGQESPIKKSDSSSYYFKKAVLLSACLPGAGQVFNSIKMTNGRKNAYWKVPLIYAGLGAAGYFLVSNQQMKNKLKDEYSLRQLGGGSQQWIDYDDQAILSLYQQHLDFRDLSILALGAVYFIQIIDAGVEAHFIKFDVSDKLSLSLKPTLMNRKSPGFSVKMSFR
jgi:hypothetical protein